MLLDPKSSYFLLEWKTSSRGPLDIRVLPQCSSTTEEGFEGLSLFPLSHDAWVVNTYGRDMPMIG